jgi:uncharacterized membrane protein YecN with MAPEG domain
MTTTRSSVLSGRSWAYTFAALGGLVSIAANVAHSYVPPQGVASGWAPQPGAVVGAIVWPIFLFGAVELLARVAWPDGLRWQLLRWGGMVPVAAVAALVSYRHLSGLLAFYGEEPIVCILGPLAVDGLMVMATGAILATGHTQHTTTVAAATTPTPAISVPATAVSVPAVDDVNDVRPAPTDAVPPASTTAATADGTAPAAPATEPAPATPLEVPTPAQLAARVTPSPTSIPLRPANRPAATRPSPRPRTTAPTSTATPLAAPAADTPVIEPEPAQLPLPYTVDPAVIVNAREVARRYRTENGQTISAGQLAARLRVNSEVAAEALKVLALDPDNATSPISHVNGSPVKARR